MFAGIKRFFRKLFAAFNDEDPRLEKFKGIVPAEYLKKLDEEEKVLRKPKTKKDK